MATGEVITAVRMTFPPAPVGSLVLYRAEGPGDIHCALTKLEDRYWYLESTGTEETITFYKNSAEPLTVHMSYIPAGEWEHV